MNAPKADDGIHIKKEIKQYQRHCGTALAKLAIRKIPKR